MKIGICKTKDNVDILYNSLYEGCSSIDEVQIITNSIQFRKSVCDVYIMVAYPHTEDFCDEHQDLQSNENSKPAIYQDFRKDIVDICKLKKIPFIVIDCGLFKCKRQLITDNYYHFVLNGLKNISKKYSDNSDEKRLNKIGLILKPKKDGIVNTVLVFGQTRFGIASQHIDIYLWYKKIFKFLEENNKQVFFLRHPNDFGKYKLGKVREIDRSIPTEEVLSMVDAAVTFSTNAVVESILSGTPTIAESKVSVGYNVCSNSIEDINNIKNTNVQDWLYNISYENWNLNELSDGSWWNYMRNKI